MIEEQNNNSVQDQDGNSSKPLLPAVYFFLVIILKIFLKKIVYINISCIFTSELKQTLKNRNYGFN